MRRVKPVSYGICMFLYLHLLGGTSCFQPHCFLTRTRFDNGNNNIALVPNNNYPSGNIMMSLCAASSDSQPSAIPDDSITARGIDIDSDPRLYRVRLSRASGIEWGTDLSFSFVYVRGLDPSGDAAQSKQVQVGDQLCELRPVRREDDEDDAVVDDDNPMKPINVVGAPFDYVMESLALLDKTVTQLDMVFFRGTKNELKAAATGSGQTGSDAETVTVMVYENKGSPQEVIHRLVAPVGVNIRQLCVDNGINVYQSVTRWTNCKGKQLCGTCIVNVPAGGIYTNRKSMDEASTLRENPETYRLSCVTFAYGDCTVETFPPINAAQWTR